MITTRMIAVAAWRYALSRAIAWARRQASAGVPAGRARAAGKGWDLVQFRRSSVEAAARQRRPGYAEAVRAATVHESDGVLWLSRDDAHRIGETYRMDRQATLCTLARRLAGELLVWLLAGGPMTPDVALDVRVRECGGCEFRAVNRDGNWTGCSLCGCNRVKLRMATAACPVGRWRAVRGESAGAGRAIRAAAAAALRMGLRAVTDPFRQLR